jgi:putative FmdB family regulatory protein
MPMYDYKCNKCKFTDEYNNSETAPPALKPPKDLKCPKCDGKLEKQFSMQGQSFDIIGYCYENEYGKKNWKSRLSQADQAEVALGNKSPY